MFDGDSLSESVNTLFCKNGGNYMLFGVWPPCSVEGILVNGVNHPAPAWDKGVPQVYIKNGVLFLFISFGIGVIADTLWYDFGNCI